MRKPPDRTKGNAPAAVTAEASGAHNQRTNQRNKQMNSIAHPQLTPSLVVNETVIRQDEEGRYSLNDLHNAAGGEEKHSPRRWLKTSQAIELIEEIERELTDQNMVLTDQNRSVKTTEGRYGGSFAVKEVVYAYTMWISATFSLRVIRSYDAMVTGGGRHNIAAGMTLDSWTKYCRLRIGILKELSLCTDIGVGRGFYGTLTHVDRFMGVVTDQLSDLAPGLRQACLDLEGGAA